MNRILFLALSCAILCGQVEAEPMDKAGCVAMSAEHKGLVAAGLKADLDKGAEWGKANLNQERLTLISRLIEVEEILAFRCRTLAIPVKRRESVPNVERAAADDIDVAAPAANPTGKVKPVKKGPSAPPASAHAAGVSGTVSGSTPDANPAAPKPNVVRLKPKAAPGKKKPPASPATETPGLFSLE